MSCHSVLTEFCVLQFSKCKLVLQWFEFSPATAASALCRLVQNQEASVWGTVTGKSSQPLSTLRTSEKSALRPTILHRPARVANPTPTCPLKKSRERQGGEAWENCNQGLGGWAGGRRGFAVPGTIGLAPRLTHTGDHPVLPGKGLHS